MSLAPNIPNRFWAAETPAALGTALRSYRTRAGLTQTELGKMLGASRKLIERLERGEVTEQTRVILAAFRVLGARLQVVDRDA